MWSKIWERVGNNLFVPTQITGSAGEGHFSPMDWGPSWAAADGHALGVTAMFVFVCYVSVRQMAVLSVFVVLR